MIVLKYVDMNGKSVTALVQDEGKEWLGYNPRHLPVIQYAVRIEPDYVLITEWKRNAPFSHSDLYA